VILAALVVVLVVVPIAEIWVIIKVGEAIGTAPTIGLLILDAVLGSLLVRSQGRAAWRRFTDALAAGRVPARETLDGVLVIFGGALVIAPGFLTDAIGALFLLPPSRAALRRAVTRRMTGGLLGAAGARLARRRRPPSTPPPYDVDGTAVDAEGQRRLR